MAVVETLATIKFKDSNSTTTVIYPTTRKDNIIGTDPVNMISDNGSAYTCDVPWISDLTAGVSFVGLPAMESTSNVVSLNVNGLGNKYLRRRVSTATGTTSSGYSDSWLSAGKPINIIYDGTFWILNDVAQASAQDLMGAVPIKNGGTGSNNGATGLANLFAAGYTVLSSYQYGDTLPEAGVPGRIFFKKVSG